MDGLFRNRADAGRRLAARLTAYSDQPNVLVLGLPRGGLPVAFEVARRVQAPLDVFLVRKLGVPGHEELAMGAIASGGVRVLNEDVVRAARISQQEIEHVTRAAQRVLEERERAYRGDRPPLPVTGQVVIVVDDGLATGATMRAAVRALRQQDPEWITVAAPVASGDVRDEFRPLVDEIVCLMTPEPFQAVGLWYDDFSEVSDDDVRALLARANEWLRRPGIGVEESPKATDGGERS